MKRIGAGVFASVMLAAVAAYGQDFGGMLDRLGDSMQKKTEDRVQQGANKAVDSVFDSTEETVKSAGQGSTEAAKPAPAAKNVAKCLATDTSCLKQAKANGQMVEIVTEEELDTMRCSTDDVGCLQRAKQLGKKVELTD